MGANAAAGRIVGADVIVVGAGLSGLVATAELTEAGRHVLLVEQESEANLGGQAWWSFGGLFLVDSPEQRRLGVKDSVELAWQDWLGTAGFDRPEDYWPRRWAEAYVNFAAGEKRAWLRERGHRIFPVVGWAERGGYEASGPGNSVPRFHITWGTGPASWNRSRAGCGKRPTPDWSPSPSGTGWTGCSRKTARSPGCAAVFWNRRRRSVAARPRAP